jgi:SNF2 family DNA or RNA helicase
MIELTREYKKMSLARSVPGAIFDRQRGAWVVPTPSPRAAAVILRLFPELGDKYPELSALRAELLQDARPIDNATPYDRRVHAPVTKVWFKAAGREFYEYQDLDLGYVADVLREHGGAYIGWERGLGKTIGAIAVAEDVGANRILVVCPNTAKQSVWADELERWMPDAEVTVLPNEKKKREAVLAKLKGRVPRLAGPVEVLVVHYEALALIAKERTDWYGWKKYGDWDLIVMDEAHRLANPKTQMHRAAMKIPTRYKLALSGSVIQNHPEEIYGVLNWLFPDNYSSKWRDWNDRFLDYVESGRRRVLIGPRVEALDEMRQELGVFMVYRRKADELDLPERTEQTLYVDLSPKQRAAYDDLRDSYVARLDSGESIVAIEPVVLLTRLRQVASGLDLVSQEVRDSSKLDLVEDLIRDDPDEPYVVFTWFRGNAVELGRRLSDLGATVVTGDTPHKQRAVAIRQFQEGVGRVFIGTISTLGESVNLHRAANAIFVDRSWNPAQNAQAQDRIYRIGQVRPVTVTNVIARNTVDELRVQPVLNDKDELRRLILGGV